MQPEPCVMARFRRATEAIRHRGPDDEGFVWLPFTGFPLVFGGPDTMPELALPGWGRLPALSGSGVLLGHRRLSILDITSAGHQPMAAAEGKVWIVFNGEIYNYIELRAELAGDFAFRTGSDTEVILAAWLAWGRDMLPRLTGMFAFAIADMRDAARPVLLLARDPFGIKPLYYAITAGCFAFASEPKALLELGAEPVVNAASLYTYLTRGCTDYAEQTLFQNIRQLPSANWMEMDLNCTSAPAATGTFWNPDRNACRDISRDEARSTVRELFLENIRLHLRSDVPLGAALSGGVDSSSIVCGIREVEPGAAIRTFSYLSEDERTSEETWMDMVAARAGAQPHKDKPSAADMAASLGALVKAQDEPFGNTSVFAQYAVFRLARRNGVKVMLDGQGADEVLAGYDGYAALRLSSLLRRWNLRSAFSFMRGAGKATGGGGMRLLRGAVMDMLPNRIAAGIKQQSRGETVPLNNTWFASRGIHRPDLPARPEGRDRMRAGLWYSTLANGLPMLLRYEDRNSMAHSVESRVPFLTVKFIEFILSLPEEYILARDGTSKSIFRDAMRGLVPDAVLDRRDKLGFTTPEARWLTAPGARQWVKQTLDSDAARSLTMLDMTAVRTQWQAVEDGRRPCPPWMWRVLNAAAWAQTFDVRAA